MALISCNQDILISEQWIWKEHRWTADDPKTISIESTDTAMVYRMDLKVEHERTYPYQNLYIRTLTVFPSGREVASITSLELTEKTGAWAGDCGKKTCTIELPLQQRFTFPEAGTYQWSVEPYMRTDTVSGIKSLTVTCRKVKG